MGTSTSKHYTSPKGVTDISQAHLELIHQANHSVLGTTPTSAIINIPPNVMVIDPAGVGHVKAKNAQSGCKGVSAILYKTFGLTSFSGEAKATLNHTGDGITQTYGVNEVGHVVSPSFAWYKGGDWTQFKSNPTLHVVNRLTSAYSQAIRLFLASDRIEAWCPPFAWGVNAGWWSSQLPTLTLHALSMAIDELTHDQREALRTTKTFKICLFKAEEQEAMKDALVKTGMHFYRPSIH